jgi:prophage DNA circulation protein
MIRSDANEAQGIVDRMLAMLLSYIPSSGAVGSDARTAIGDARANAYTLICADAFGPALQECFDQAQQAGIRWDQLEAVREQVAQETPVSLGAVLIQNAGIKSCLATMAINISGLTFVSRDDVETIKTALFQPFMDAEEIAADEMDQATFQSLITLHGAITNHLVQTALPLPKMMNYRFYKVLPSLVVAYKLYSDASRCDEVVAENKIVHPAFCPLMGEALSA